MTGPLADRWHDRDLLVLRAAVKILDDHPHGCTLERLMEETSLSQHDVSRAALSLRSGGLVHFDEGWVEPHDDWRVDMITEVSGQAIVLSGAWPSAETIADRLLATLNELVDSTTDPVEKGRLRRAADAVGSLTRDTLVSVAGAAAGVAMQ